jgi:hypothetical protein
MIDLQHVAIAEHTTAELPRLDVGVVVGAGGRNGRKLPYRPFTRARA